MPYGESAHRRIFDLLTQDDFQATILRLMPPIFGGAGMFVYIEVAQNDLAKWDVVFGQLCTDGVIETLG